MNVSVCLSAVPFEQKLTAVHVMQTKTQALGETKKSAPNLVV